MAAYDLNAIADALAGTWRGMDTQTIDAHMVPLTAYADVPAVANVPAVAVELDDISWDVSMDRGADSFLFLAYLIVSEADSETGQRQVRQALSTGGLMDKIKDKLVSNQRLGGLVSYAHMSGTRSIGAFIYNGVAYLGAIIEIEVMS